MSKELQDKERVELETVQNERWLRPAVDVYENENEWLIVGDLPGIEKNALDLHLEGKELTIEGKRPGGEDEFNCGSYRRVFELPRGVDAEKVSAALHHGVFTIHLPKVAALKPRQIVVKAG